MLKLAMLISGGGTTATAICTACKPGGSLHGLIKPSLVISSSAQAKGLERTVQTGMIASEDCHVVEPKAHPGDAFGGMIMRALDRKNVDIIGQYGWLPRTPNEVIAAYDGAIINQHPGPLDPGHPDFGGKGMYGRRVHCARLFFARNTEGNMWTEVVGQYVEPEFDKGMVLKSERVLIEQNDTVDTLQARCLEAEYRVQIALLEDFAHDRVSEIQRTERLVRKHERNTLALAKMLAGTLYPDG
jgi:phosphoribosylglycinamide formyltransferase-1